MTDGILSLLLILVAAPLIRGIIQRAKAFFQMRVGPPVLQPYFDLWKLLHKGEVIPEPATFLFTALPWINFAATVAATTLVPALGLGQVGPGDAIAFAALLALARFALIVAAFDGTSNFTHMGASREMAIGAVIEPALIGCLAGLAIVGGGSGLGAIAESRYLAGPAAFGPAALMILVALILVAQAESGRVPFDNPDTHLELTMVHEGMLLEHSGRSLALLAYAAQIKQAALIVLTGTLLFPIGWGDPLPAALAWVVRVMAIALIFACIETANAKLRILRVPQLLVTATAIAGAGVVVGVALGG